MSVSAHALKAYYTSLLHLHQEAFGLGISEYREMSSHGSDRIILRLISASGSSTIGIINENTDENRAFLSFGRHFRKHGLNTPKIFAESRDLKTYILEDLGDETLMKRITSDGEFTEQKKELYRAVLAELPKFQITAGKGIDYSLCYQYGEFAGENIEYDIDYFKERFLKLFCEGMYNEASLDKDLAHLSTKLLELPRDNFLYRDFQARNIMIKNDRLFYIDFQSGRKGALLYDPASLLYNSRANIPQPAREELLGFYLDNVIEYIPIEKEKYMEYFWYFAIIRILQVLGAYGFLGVVKGKNRFLESVPFAIGNIGFILSNRIGTNEFPELRSLFRLLETQKHDLTNKLTAQ
jgi:aminoglycoside/choline kinase family phosphotransferase